MRKIVISFFILVLICFCIPIMFTKQKEVQETVAEEIVEVVEEPKKEYEIGKYDYGEYSTIKLLHSKTGVVEEVLLDEYLCNVVAAEMPAQYNLEAIKAQATVARSYTLHKILNGSKHENAHICDDSTCCQAWISKEDRFAKWEEATREENWNKIRQAVQETVGKGAFYDGKIINAFFHASSGGMTELPINVWGGDNYPYLQVVQTVGEEAYTQYNSEVTFTKQQLTEKIKEKYPDIAIDYSLENCIQIIEYTSSGRVKTVKFGNVEMAGVEARTVLGLKSANFAITIDGDNVNFKVIGYGHGVGMSQTGADALAKQGLDYQGIIKHYYVGVEIQDI